MAILFPGFLILAFIFAILAVRTDSVICQKGCAGCAIGFLVSMIVFVVLAVRVPIEGKELEYKKEMMEIVVETVDFQNVSDENLEVIAKNLVEVNTNLEWYKEHQHTFWYFCLLNTPQDNTEIKVDDLRLIEAMRRIECGEND